MGHSTDENIDLGRIDLNIHGQHFLNLTISDLDELLQRSLPMPELLRLHKEIRALNNSDHMQVSVSSMQR